MPSPRPGEDAMHPTVRQYVNSRHIAEGYDHCFADNPLFTYDCLFIRRHLSPPGRVLDLGCGTGRHLLYLHAEGFQPTGVDLNPHMLERARENGVASGKDLDLVLADMLRLPFRWEPLFDGILLMFSTLGLVQKQRARVDLLRDLRALMRPGGTLLLHVHNAEHPFSPARESWGQGLWGTVRQGLGLSERGDAVMRNYRGLQDLYCHFFSAREIRATLSRAGYRIAELEPLNATRSGPHPGPDALRHANGFLIAARPN